MAAKADPGKSTKVQVRTCLTCTTRLSELCYDTHTLCEKCRGQVCGYDSFCDECRLWTKEFRRMYMKHQRTLHQKRVSKGNAKAKAKSPPVVDDAASNVSMESHVSLPVVILPLDPQSVDADDNLTLSASTPIAPEKPLSFLDFQRAEFSARKLFLSCHISVICNRIDFNNVVFLRRKTEF